MGSRFIDVMLGFPQIVMAILVVSILGVGLVNVVIAVAIACVPRFARVIRGAVLVLKEQPFIEAARALGAGDIRIMLRHLLPNAVPTLVVLGTLELGNAILTTATLSFLGLGAQPASAGMGRHAQLRPRIHALCPVDHDLPRPRSFPGCHGGEPSRRPPQPSP